MDSVNKMGFRVAAVTAIVVVALFGVAIGISYLYSTFSSPKDDTQDAPTPTAIPSVAPEQLTKDSDNDGLPDLVENIYRTDPNNSDSDQDGVLDGDEVNEGRDPTVQGPGDVVKPDTGIAVENPVEGTYTEQYFATLPEDASREEVIDKARIEAFVNQTKSELLPELTADDIIVSDKEGKQAVQEYLETISADHNDAVEPVTSTDIDAAYELATLQKEPEALENIVAALEKNYTTFKQTSAPQEVASMHLQFTQASYQLLENVKQLQKGNQDFIGALMAAKNVEDLSAEFTDVADQVKALEEKYDLE